jgi:hypothetical protein
MEGLGNHSGRMLKALAVAAVLAVLAPAVPAGEVACPLENRMAGEGKQPENRVPARERCKRSDKSNASKTCPDGGERVPQDKRSPLDDAPPLSPLVA